MASNAIFSKAVDDAYSLNALLTVCHSALQDAENCSVSDAARITGAVSRTLREVALPMVSEAIDFLETREREEVTP
jgi:hypothetical protein